jgi:hypothetical protein
MQSSEALIFLLLYDFGARQSSCVSFLAAQNLTATLNPDQGVRSSG